MDWLQFWVLVTECDVRKFKIVTNENGLGS